MIIFQLRCEAYRRALEKIGMCPESVAIVAARDRKWLEEGAVPAEDVHATLKAADITPTTDASAAYRLGLAAGQQKKNDGSERNI